MLALVTEPFQFGAKFERSGRLAGKTDPLHAVQRAVQLVAQPVEKVARFGRKGVARRRVVEPP